MKLICQMLALIVIFGHSASFAKKKPKNVISTNIGTVAFGNYELNYERKLSSRFSLSAGAIYYETRKVLWQVFSYGYMPGISVMPKFHVFGKALKNSFYLAPSLRMGYLVHPPKEATDIEDRGIMVRTGVNFGYQHIFNKVFMMDFTAGLEHYHNFLISRQATRYQDSGKILVRPYLALSLGYAF